MENQGKCTIVQVFQFLLKSIKFFETMKENCDSATPAIPKIKSKKYISIYFY